MTYVMSAAGRPRLNRRAWRMQLHPGYAADGWPVAHYLFALYVRGADRCGKPRAHRGAERPVRAALRAGRAGRHGQLRYPNAGLRDPIEFPAVFRQLRFLPHRSPRPTARPSPRASPRGSMPPFRPTTLSLISSKPSGFLPRRAFVGRQAAIRSSRCAANMPTTIIRRRWAFP